MDVLLSDVDRTVKDTKSLSKHCLFETCVIFFFFLLSPLVSNGVFVNSFVVWPGRHITLVK